MIPALATIRQWSWLFIVLVIGVVLVLPVVGSAEFQLLKAETSDVDCESEEIEVDDPLDLMPVSASGSLSFLSGHFWCVSDQLVDLQLIAVTSHFRRGPPAC